MSNPYIPNTASMPNILFDYWMAQLTDGEFKVLMAIARKTYGWHKIRDKISLKQIELMTGLSRKGITKILDALVERRLIIKTKSKTESGDDAPNTYEINVDCEERCGFAEGGGRELSTLGGSEPSSLGVVNSVHPQNPLIQNPILQKKEADKPPISPPSRRKKVQEEMEELSPRVWLTKSQQEALLKKVKDDTEKVKKIYEKLSDWKIANNIEGGSDYQTILKWVIKAVSEDEHKVNNQNSCHEKDRVLAEKIWNRYKGRIQQDISLSAKYLEFIQGVNAPSIVLEFGSKEFRNNCLEQLRKRRLNTEGL